MRVFFSLKIVHWLSLFFVERFVARYLCLLVCSVVLSAVLLYSLDTVFPTLFNRASASEEWLDLSVTKIHT